MGKSSRKFKDSESVLLTDWYENCDRNLDDKLSMKWDKFITLRKDINKSLELARQGENKIIGNALDAKVILHITDETLKEFIKVNKILLKEIFLVSQLEISDVKDDKFIQGEETEQIFIKIEHADGEKCERCWQYSLNIGENEEYPTICPRCTQTLVRNS